MWSNFLKLSSSGWVRLVVCIFDQIIYGGDTAKTSQNVHNLDAYIDSAISFTKNITRLTRTCLFHNSQLWSIRRSQTIVSSSSYTLVKSLFRMHLNYCVGHLNGVPKCLVSILHLAHLIMWLHRTVWSAGYVPRCTGWTFQ